jgi:hypothetical protein
MSLCDSAHPSGGFNGQCLRGYQLFRRRPSRLAPLPETAGCLRRQLGPASDQACHPPSSSAVDSLRLGCTIRPPYNSPLYRIPADPGLSGSKSSMHSLLPLLCSAVYLACIPSHSNTACDLLQMMAADFQSLRRTSGQCRPSDPDSS